MLGRDEDADGLLMIGTAGHVDHGKTRLVRILTGCETDRLREEKERGLSIELGFAPCSLGAGVSAGIVDVPGHEHFIKNMVAGAAGMDLAIMVVAADDGVMPQTVEHLEIMQFLGVRHGLVVITKTDLVPPGRVEEVRAQVGALVKDTFLQGAPVCAVSSETGEGIMDFYRALVATALAAKITRPEGVFRMPVERVFSVPGYGTVATGIPLAGSVAVGEEVEVQPGDARARVRGIQRFLRDARRGGAGQCLALNLAGLPQTEVKRGDVIAVPGYVRPSRYLQVRLTTCRDLSSPLRNGEEIRIHTGTSEIQGALALYGSDSVGRKESAFAAVRLQEVLAASPTDCFVLRRNSPTITVAGGVILRALPGKPRGTRMELAEELAARWASFTETKARFEYHVLASDTAGIGLSEAAVEALLPLARARAIALSLAEHGRIVPCPGGEYYLHVAARDRAVREFKAFLGEYYAHHPSAYGPTMTEAGAALGLPEIATQLVVEWMVERGMLERREQRIAPHSREDQLDAERTSLAHRIEELYEEGRFATPRPDEVGAALGAAPSQVAPLLDYLCQKGTLVRLGEKVVFHARWMEEAERIVVGAIRKEGALDSADFKKLIGSSRKYALAILDHFDTIHITQRSGNLRRLHPAYVRKHPESPAPPA